MKGNIEARLEEAHETIDRLRDAIWKVYGILGFDTDGDTEYCGVQPIEEFLIYFCTSFRADYDEVQDEAYALAQASSDRR